MNSDKECRPPRHSLDGLRRSKRFAISDQETLKTKVAKKSDDKAAQTVPGRTKSKRGRQPKHRPPPKKKESSNSFSGDCLTPEELHQLYLKFTRDGHFRANLASVSTPPLVISRTTDGKFVTTKIEYNDNNHQNKRDLGSRFATKGTEARVTGENYKPPTVTFSTPVEENPCTSRENPKSFLATGNSQENRFFGNSTGSNLHPKFFSPQENRLDMSSSAFSFVNSTRQTHPSWPNIMTPILADSPSGTWFVPFVPPSQTALENISDSNARGFYFPSAETPYNNTFGSNQASRCDNSNGTCENPQNLPNRYNYSNFDAAGMHDPSAYQQRQTSTQSSTYPLQNSFNSNSDWNATRQTSSNAFGGNSATIPNNAMNLMPESTNYCIPPRNMDCNSIGSNNCNSSMNEYDGYYSPYATWNNFMFPNSYISATDSTQYNGYNASNMSGRCETATRATIGDQSSMENQMNTWALNDQFNDFSSMTLNNYSSVTAIDSKVTDTIADSGMGLPQSSIEQTEELGSSLEVLGDSQGNGLCHTFSSDSSDDNDIGYHNYMEENLMLKDEHLEK